MGIILNQSVKNTVVTFIGFAIGAVNALFMYTHFLGEDYYGLTAFILSSANILMPFMAFGVQNTLVKFYAMHFDEDEKSKFLNLMLALPLALIVPVFVILFIAYDPIAAFLSRENTIIYNYLWMAPVIALFMAYFEIFYAWAKVQFRSVFGNFIKEVVLRILISLLLLGVYFEWLGKVQFLFALVVVYGLVTILMGGIAFKIRKPKFKLKFPTAKREFILFSSYIIFSSGIAVLLLDIDRFMIGQYIPIKETAYYSVAIFIALTISVPLRAMHQITHPVTTDLMARQQWTELNALYKKTSITLQVIGGWVMLGILTNIHEVYEMLPEKYSGGISVVFIIAFSKYFDLILGNNNSIIFNSKYYKTVLLLGIFLVMVTIGLNMWFIPRLGIEGAAWATFISIGLYSLAKLSFVVTKMKLFPFTEKSLLALGISVLTFVLFSFWSLKIHPVPAIIIKSLLLTIFYFFMTYSLKLSDDINNVLCKWIKIK